MPYVLVTAPTVEPISLDQAKRQCRVEHGELDATISGYVVGARQHFERQTRRSLNTQTWRLVLDQFPACGSPIRLGRGPILSVVSLTYIDTAGATQTATLADYIIDLSGDVGRIVPAIGEPWPCTYRRPGAVSVQFTAGHGPLDTDVPQLIRNCLLLQVERDVDPASDNDTAIQRIIDSYWNPELG